MVFGASPARAGREVKAKCSSKGWGGWREGRAAQGSAGSVLISAFIGRIRKKVSFGLPKLSPDGL